MSVLFSNLLAILLLVLVVGSASGYIYKEKKKGVRCIGCPSGGSCSGHCSDTEMKNAGDPAAEAAFRIGLSCRKDTPCEE